MKKNWEKITLGILFLSPFSAFASVNVCYNGSCQSMDKYSPYLMGSQLNEMFSSGSKELVLCEADKNDKRCLDVPLSFSARSNLANVDFQIPFVRFSNVKQFGYDLKVTLDYQVKTNQYYPLCMSTNSSFLFDYPFGKGLKLNSEPFECAITELGKTKISLNFNIDYINLDTGYFGGSYQASVQGSVLGGGSGYAMLQLTNKRALEKKVPEPQKFITSNGEYMEVKKDGKIYTSTQEPTGLVNWDWDNIKTKWNNFKEKFLKILYLEPLND